MLFPFHPQQENNDCGLSCLQMIAHFAGKNHDRDHIKKLLKYNGTYISMLQIYEASLMLNFEALCVEITTERLIEDAPLPCILFWHINHFVILYEIKRSDNFVFKIADPSCGFFSVSIDEFNKYWKYNKTKKGKALLFNV